MPRNIGQKPQLRLGLINRRCPLSLSLSLPAATHTRVAALSCTISPFRRCSFSLIGQVVRSKPAQLICFTVNAPTRVECLGIYDADSWSSGNAAPLDRSTACLTGPTCLVTIRLIAKVRADRAQVL